MVLPTSNSISDVASSSVSVSLVFCFFWAACWSWEKFFSIALLRLSLIALSEEFLGRFGSWKDWATLLCSLQWEGKKGSELCTGYIWFSSGGGGQPLAI